MKWELARHDWGQFGDPRLKDWIADFIVARDATRANELLTMIESQVVPPNHGLRLGASAVAACLVQGLLSATPIARVEVLHLLFQLAGSAVEENEMSTFVRDVRREIKLGLPVVAEIAETGTRTERLQCIDLLSMCARFDRYCFRRARALLSSIADMGDEEASSVNTELKDLADFAVSMAW